MRDVQLLAGDNVVLLRLGIELLRRLDDELFAASSGFDGVGKQYRHLLDFYHSFFQGLESSKIDYEGRERDPRLETDRRFAIETTEALVAGLQNLTLEEDRMELRVRAERPEGRDGASPWSRSSVTRELQFLMSHTVHHFALIKAMLRSRGFELDRDFGVSPSTLRYWQESSVSTT